MNDEFFRLGAAMSSQVETGRKTLILQGMKTSGLLNSVLTEIYHLKKESSVRYTRKNDNVRPFESGGETSLEFFSQKTDCSMFVVSLGFWFLLRSMDYAVLIL